MMGHKDVKSDLPYLTYNREVSSHIAMGFGDAPIRHGSYAPKGGDAK